MVLLAYSSDHPQSASLTAPASGSTIILESSIDPSYAAAATEGSMAGSTPTISSKATTTAKPMR